MYARFINEQHIEEAPAEILFEDRKYVGFNPSFLHELGYKPVLSDDKPTVFNSTGTAFNDERCCKTFEAYFVEYETYIQKKWRAVSESK